jgi:uncharacterized protein YecE (DUF72 family)
MDSSFYRPPSAETVTGWCEVTTDEFTFTVRVPRQVTHVDRLGIPARVGQFAGSLRSLGPRFGCLLFATPPTLDRDVERLRATLNALPDGTQTAWEFRHPSWFAVETLDLLVTRYSAPVVVETLDGLIGAELLPGGRWWDEWRLPLLYVRFRKDNYRPSELIAWGELLAEAAAQGRSVFGFFRQCPESSSYVIALGEVIAERLASMSIPAGPPAGGHEPHDRAQAV